MKIVIEGIVGVKLKVKVLLSEEFILMLLIVKVDLIELISIFVFVYFNVFEVIVIFLYINLSLLVIGDNLIFFVVLLIMGNYYVCLVF